MTTVSLQTIATLFGSEEKLIAPVITQSSDDGTSILSFVLTAEGEIPEDGLIVTVDSDIQFRDNFAFLAERPFQVGGELVGAVFNEAGEATGFKFKMTASKALINLRPQDNTNTAGNRSFNFTLEPGEGYEVDAKAGKSTVIFYERLADVPAPMVTPTVSLSIDTDTLSEAAGNRATLTFRLSEPPPPEGLLLQIKGDSAPGTRLLSEFDLFNATVTGGAFPAPDGAANGFFFKVTEQTATLTLAAFKDEDLEGVKEVTIKLEESSGYKIAEDAGSVSLNVVDDENSQLQVSFTTEPAVLIESEKTVSVHNFSLSATPPEEGLIVSVVAPIISEFDLSGIQTEGGEIARVTPTGFDFKITAKNAKIELPVADDGEDEGLEEAVFTLQDAPEYQVNPDAIVGSFQIVDTPDQAPVLTVGEPNDIIEKAVNTNLTPANNIVSFTSTLDFSFRNSYEGPDGTTIYVDATEDVDMYKVSLKAGDTIYVDTDANQTEPGRKVDPVLRVFDAAGKQVAFNGDAGAPDEGEFSGFEAYVEYTAPADGDYYIGVSLHYNDKYDPNVPASGSGGQEGEDGSDPEGYGPGEYTLNINLNQPFRGEPTFIPPGDGTGPEVSLFTTTGIYNLNSGEILATGLAETLPEGAGSGVVLVLTTEGEIPEAGVEVFINSTTALADYGLTFPSTRGGQVTGFVYDNRGSISGIRFRIEEPLATITLNPIAAEEAETDGAEPITFSVVESQGYITSAQNSSVITFYDTVEQIPAPISTPEVSLALSPADLLETEQTQLTLSLSLDQAPPPGGVQVYVSSGVPNFLGEFAVFEAEFVGGVAISDGQAGGFYFQMFEQTATVTLPVFADDIQEGIEQFQIAVVPGAGYTVDPVKAEAALTIRDTTASKVQLSATAEPAVLVESEGTELVLTLNLSAPPPADGIPVTLEVTPLLLRLLSQNVTVTGGSLIQFPTTAIAPGTPEMPALVSLTMTGQEAVIKVPIGNSDAVSGLRQGVGIKLKEEANYQVDPATSEIEFTVVDTPDQAPPEPDPNREPNGSNDTLETAINTGLNANNRTASFEGAMNQHILGTEDNPDVNPLTLPSIDNTEDVDLYKVELTAGQDLIIDVDATELGSKLQFAQIRVFDADGKELAKTGANSFQAAPDEVFSVFNDPYLEFTAESAGTYYVGISQIGNDYYDPKVAGSGSGWIFPAAEILPDKYTLNLTVGPELIIDPPPPPEPPVEPPISDTITLSALNAYYTFAGNISPRSDVRLLADKANVIGFPGRETFSFLQFDPTSLPANLLDQEFSVTLTLQHDSSLAPTLIPATDDRPVSLSVYDLTAPFNSSQPGGNIADIDYGEDGANAVDTIQVGNDGLYNWDVTSLIQQWAVDPTNNDGVALSGFYGNVDIDGRNSYGIFHTVGSTTGQVPILTIKTLGGGGSSPQTLYGTSASETLAGGQANDTLYGNGGEDFLNGRAGNDLIYGGSEADTIVGGSGDDVIYANGGGDLINAGTGMDTVWLGSGAATVVLNEGEGYVTVKNFQLGATQFRGAGSGLSFADSADGVKISKGDDLLAVVTWQTASTFRENASIIFV